MAHHWRHRHRRLYTRRPLEVNSRRGPWLRQVLALLLFCIASGMLLLVSGHAGVWTVAGVLAVWFFGLEAIVRPYRDRE